METVTLNVELRQGTGKEKAGRLRRTGKVPGVCYGQGKRTAAVCVDAREFRFKVERMEGSHLIQFASPLPELNEKLVLVKEVQRHPVTSEVLHLDFYEVDETKPIQTTVPLHFVGKPEGVTAGGVLQAVRRDITVECLPRNIPEFLELDVSGLKIHDAIHIEELPLPPGVKAVYDTNVTLVTVLPPTVIEEAPVEVAAEEAAAAEVEAAAPAEGAEQEEEK
jgi:large subunit ribosomal protein L25